MKGEAPRPEITWVTKYGKAKLLLTPEQMEHAEKRFYFFESKAKKNTALPTSPAI